jgi:hypothetical protein
MLADYPTSFRGYQTEDWKCKLSVERADVNRSPRCFRLGTPLDLLLMLVQKARERAHGRRWIALEVEDRHGPPQMMADDHQLPHRISTNPFSYGPGRHERNTIVGGVLAMAAGFINLLRRPPDEVG